MTEKRDTFYRPADLPDLRVGKPLSELELEPGSYRPCVESIKALGPELVPGSTRIGTQAATGLTVAYERAVRHEAELAERVRCALVILSTCGTYDGRTKDALIEILEGTTPNITRKL